MNYFTKRQLQRQHKMHVSGAMITRPLKPDTPVDYTERSGAAFLPTLESHVIVPLAEAIISGLFAGFVVGTVVGIVAIIGDQSWKIILLSGFASGFLATYIMSWRAWNGHLSDYKALLWYTEFAEGPEPQQENRQVHEARVKINQNWIHADLPFDRDNPQALVDFASAIVSGIAPFSERGAGRYGYSVTRFNELRDNFIKGHLAYWKNPKNKREGVGLSRSGITLLQSVASNPPPIDYEPSADWGMSPEMVQK